MPQKKTKKQKNRKFFMNQVTSIVNLLKKKHNKSDIPISKSAAISSWFLLQIKIPSM